mgnify:FL=1
MVIILPLNGTSKVPRVAPGNAAAVHRKEVLLTSSPIAIPDGGVIVTLYWLALAPPPIKFALKS